MWDTGIKALKVGGVTISGEIHADGLSGMELLEAAFEVFKGRLSIPDDGRFVREVESTLRIVVVLRARADDICV